MKTHVGYKKYMKKETHKNNNFFVKLFIGTLFGMLLIFTLLFKSFIPNVDVTIGDYQPEPEITEEAKNSVDGRLSMIQNEDQGRDFSDIIADAERREKVIHQEPTTITNSSNVQTYVPESINLNSNTENNAQVPQKDSVYKVYVGTYTSLEQAKVAKDIIQESGTGLNPIVKCIGSNNYTLQVGIFKNKNSAESLLYTVQQNHLPGRIIQEF